MNNQEEMIKRTFENMKTIYMETSKILLDVDSLMDNSGWCCEHSGNTIGTEQSKNINNPSAWITPYVSRYFVSKEGGNIMKAVGILFMDRKFNPVEPIVAISTFDMKTDGEGKRMPYGFYYVSCAWFDFVNTKEINAELAFEERKFWNFNRGKLKAFPLTELKDQESLKTLVVEPLLGMEL